MGAVSNDPVDKCFELVTAHLLNDIEALRFSVEHLPIAEAGNVLGAAVGVAGNLVATLAEANGVEPIDAWREFCQRFARLS